MTLSEISFALVLLKALVALAQEHQGNVYESQINEQQGQVQENHGQVLHPQEQVNQHQEHVNQHQEQVYHHQEQAHQHQEQVHQHQEHILQEHMPHQEHVHLHQGHVHHHQDQAHQHQEQVHQQNLEETQGNLEQVPHQHEPAHHSEAPNQPEAKLEGQNPQLLKFSEHDLQHHLYEEAYLDSSGMSESEKQYHFFVAHDHDNDWELDGTEIMQSLYHGEDELVIPEEDLAFKIDYLMKEFDFNQNGKLDFPEFMASSARFQ
ncbi:sex-determining region Y protein-like isoform X2 [Macrobrachium rosenbergii]